jgi:hypothetical protein
MKKAKNNRGKSYQCHDVYADSHYLYESYFHLY